MKKYYKFKTKAAITSILICVMFLSITTLSPATIEQQIQRNFSDQFNNLTSIENNNGLDEKYIGNDQILRDEYIELIQHRIDLPNGLIIDIVDFFELNKLSNETSKESCLEKIRIITNDIELFFKDKKSINSLSVEFRELHSIFSKHLDKYPTFDRSKNIQSLIQSDFDDYWLTYNDALNIWSGSLSEIAPWLFLPIIGSFIKEESYYNWESKVLNIGDSVILLSASVGAIFSIILSIIPIDTGAGIVTNVICWFVLLFLIVFDVSMIAYVNNGHEYMHRLCEKEVDIELHIVDEQGNGIDNLYVSYGIEACNNDAISMCNGELGKTPNLFKYYLGPSIYMDENGEKGWYSLKTRYVAEGHSNIKENYRKAPCPPGSWTITISGNSHYEYHQPITMTIGSGETVIIDPIILESRD